MSADDLLPYVPRLVVDWLRDEPQTTHRTIDATAMFADVSGFTDLTERLARNGKAGAEEMGDILNRVFGRLLDVAYGFGAGLIKWGGDAVLLLFEGPEHAARASRAAWEMQAVMRNVGRVMTSRGKVELRMSIGVHTGPFELFLVGSQFRELVVSGPGASELARMETAAQAGEIAVSAGTIAALGGVPTTQGADASLLAAPPQIGELPNRAPPRALPDLEVALPAPLVEHLSGGVVDHEHRTITVCFVEFAGVDNLLAIEGVGPTTDAVAAVIDLAQRAADAYGVTLLATDIYPGGGKIILAGGIPRATGDANARVLAAARSVVDGATVLPMRAGVARGRVFVGNYGPEYRKVYSVTGDDVNLAARLMARAAPGQVLTTPAVVAGTRAGVAFDELAPFHVKGKAAPVTAVAVTAVGGAAAAADDGADFIGREVELRALLDAAAAATDGSGSAVEVVGAAGIGKSRLVNEVVARAGLRCVRVDGDVYGGATPFAAVRRLLEDVLDGAALADAPLIAAAMGSTVAESPEVAALPGPARRARLREAVAELLTATVVEPTIFVVNDVHFMDEASLDVLGHLGASARDQPWVVLFTRRPDWTWPDPPTRLSTIELGALSTGDARRVLTGALGSRAVPTHRLAQLVERSGGNPLFLRELAATLADGDAELPGSVEEVIGARLDQLRPADRAVLRAAAVLGMVVDPDLLDELAPLGTRESLDTSGLAEFLTADAAGTLRFAHHLVRETAYEGLPFRRRVHLHAAAAESLARRGGDDPTELAALSLHCFLGRRFADAFDHSVDAGIRARAQFANVEAAELFERAAACLPHVRSRRGREVPALWEQLGDVYLDLAEFARAEACLARARRAGRANPVAWARLAHKTARQRQQTGRYRDSLRWASRGRAALAAVDSPDARTVRARLGEHYAHVLFAQGRYHDALGWADRAITEAMAAGDRRLQARATEVRLLSASALGEPVDSSLAASSVSLSEIAADVAGVARAHNVWGLLALDAGDWGTAIEQYALAAQACERAGRPLEVALQRGNQAEILVSQGRLDDAEVLLEEAMQVWRGAEAVGELAFGTAQLGRIACARGRWSEGRARFAEARAGYGTVGEMEEVATMDTLTAECLLAGGDAEAAAELARVTSEGLSGDQDGLRPALDRVLGAALVALGDRELGARRLRAALDGSRRRQGPFETARTLGALLEAGVGAAHERARWHQERTALLTGLGVRIGPPDGVASEAEQ